MRQLDEEFCGAVEGWLGEPKEGKVEGDENADGKASHLFMPSHLPLSNGSAFRCGSDRKGCFFFALDSVRIRMVAKSPEEPTKSLQNAS